MKAAAAAALAVIGIPVWLSGQRFRVEAEAVRVDVLVMNGNRPVAGLTAADFELRDRGVPQRIDAISFEDVPLSVMMALDASSSVWGEPLEDLRRAALAVTRLLRAEDRAALITFSHRLTRYADWTGDRQRLETAIARVEAEGATSLHDAAFAALTLRDDRPGRTVVLIFSDGQDTTGWLPGQYVLDAARRSDAVVYAVGLQNSLSERWPGHRFDFRSGVQPDIPNVVPAALWEPLLQALADETGGKYLRAERSDRLHDTFVQILNEVRTRYLLTYTPRKVDAGGWHPIEVKLKDAKGSVSARRGYLK